MLNNQIIYKACVFTSFCVLCLTSPMLAEVAKSPNTVDNPTRKNASIFLRNFRKKKPPRQIKPSPVNKQVEKPSEEIKVELPIVDDDIPASSDNIADKILLKTDVETPSASLVDSLPDSESVKSGFDSITLESEGEGDVNDNLVEIIHEKKKQQNQNIDTINFIQPSFGLSEEQQGAVDALLSRSEQEQLLILWKATLERNKTIRFIVQKLAPDNANKKRNQVLSQILNTAVFLPFYALQTVAPTDTSALASVLGAGVASDIINGVSRKGTDKLILTQTEMVIMFMMIDDIAERVRTQYKEYKLELVDYSLARNELEEAKQEAAASLNVSSDEARFLSQIRIRQIEREMKRINARLRSNRVTLLDLCGAEALHQTEELIKKEIDTIINAPPLI